MSFGICPTLLSNVVVYFLQGRKIESTPLAMYNFFIERVRANLHVVLAMSPIGDAFRSRMRMFPSLINCCTIDWFQVKLHCVVTRLERFSYDLDMKTREQNRNNKRTEIERFDWCMKRIQTHLAFGWLSERSGKQTSCPKNFLEIALTSYCNTIGQSNNAFSILGFLWRENEEVMF